MITNPASGTNLHEIAPGIYRINTPVEIPGGTGFSFNQYLVADDEPLLFHTGPRRLFSLHRRGDRQGHAARATALLRVLALRGRRVRVAERLPRRRAGRRSRLQPGGRDGVGRRRCRPPGAGAGRRRGASHRPPRLQVAGRAARAARLGMRLHDGTRDAHPALRRPLHPGRFGRRGAHRGRHPRPERGLPPDDGLLRACAADRRDPRAPCPRSSRRSSPACTAARGAAMARRFCVRSRAPSPAQRQWRPPRRSNRSPEKGEAQRCSRTG